MKKVSLMCIAVFILLVSGCYKDDIDDLQDQIDKLNQEQQAQAEKMKEYQTLLNALNAKLTVTGLTESAEGYKVTFSDGSTMTVKHGTTGTNGTDGQNGADGKDAPVILSVEERNGQVLFNMSDGTVIKMDKIKPVAETVALYILSEGTMGGNNSDLTYYDVATGTLTKKYYSTQNDGSSLGETGNDLKLYGSKMYCTVSGPSMTVGGFIKVIDPKTGKLIKSIPATDADGNPDMPRCIALTGGRVYVTAYSGSVMRIDTATLEIDGRAKLSGTFSEGICTYGNNLYVCNSGQGPGNTISVVGLAEFKETKTIATVNNPMMIEPAPGGDIYFTAADYTWGGGNPSNLYKFNVSNTGTITAFDIRAGRLAVGKDYVYTIDTDWATMGSIIKRVNLKSATAEDFPVSKSFYLGYKICVNPVNGDVYFTNQMGQDIYVYDQAGTQKLNLKTGIQNGAAVVFINR